MIFVRHIFKIYIILQITALIYWENLIKYFSNFYLCRKRRRRSGDHEQSRQNTFLCDFTEDKTQYASFIPRTDLKYDVTLQKASTDDVSSHLTTINFPTDFRLYACDSPDVVYSPRIPRGSYQNTMCEACRTCSQSVSTSHASVYQSQEMFHPTYGTYGKYLNGVDSQQSLDGKHPGESQQPEVMNISGNSALYDTVSNISLDKVVSVWKIWSSSPTASKKTMQ